jgi:hypothetical protein
MSDERWRKSPLRSMTPKGPGQAESADEALIRQTFSDALHLQKVARMKGANDARRATAAAQAARALKLSANRLSAAVIGIRMATEDGRSERPYSERQVRKWLALAKKG